jgi:flagellar motor component MotA
MFGGAIGALIIGNPGHLIKGAFGAIKKSFSSPRRNEQKFQDILCLLFTIT